MTEVSVIGHVGAHPIVGSPGETWPLVHLTLHENYQPVGRPLIKAGTRTELPAPEAAALVEAGFARFSEGVP